MEWCGRYHTQLFRKGWSTQCLPCRHTEEEHEKRHRELAELLHELKQYGQVKEPSSAAAANGPSHLATPTPLSKKERKAAKKLQKLAVLPKVITAADIDFVAKVLHPHDHASSEADEERRLLDDPDIKLNLYYHKGTNNTREARYRRMERLQDGSRVLVISSEEVEAVLAELKVPALAKAANATEHQLIESIRKAVHNDLLNVAKEQEMVSMRKAGFWRWANKKAYNKLLENGRFWDQKAPETPKHQDSSFSWPSTSKENSAARPSTLKRQDSVVAGPSTAEEEKEEEKEIVAGPSTPKEKVVARSSKSKEKVVARPHTPKENVAAEDSARKNGRSLAVKHLTTSKRPQGHGARGVGSECTQIGKARAALKPAITLKLSGNGGLGKLMVKPTGQYGALGAGMGCKIRDEDEDEDEDD